MIVTPFLSLSLYLFLSLSPSLSPSPSQEHKVLVVGRLAGDWNIHTCSNCDTDVYVTHTHKEMEEGGRVFVTGNLMVSGEANLDTPAKLVLNNLLAVYCFCEVWLK